MGVRLLAGGATARSAGAPGALGSLLAVVGDAALVGTERLAAVGERARLAERDPAGDAGHLDRSIGVRAREAAELLPANGAMSKEFRPAVQALARSLRYAVGVATGA